MTVLSKIAGACALVLVSGCSQHTVVGTPAMPPDAEPADPLPWAGAEAMNTEFYIGTADEERAELLRFAKEINEIQAKQSKDHAQPAQRGFHAKSHGCLWGWMEPLPDRDPRTRYGIFADGQPSRPIWVRFSNAVGWSQPDSERDARGMAIKVMGVPGDKYGEEKSSQDFLMTNSPTPVGENGEEFMSFARANSKGLFPSLLFLLAHIHSGAPALLATDPIDSSVTSQYWSGGAFHLGAHQTIKLSAKPCAGSPTRTPSKDDPDYLRADLAHAAERREGVCYTLYAQFQVNPIATPIENAAHEWKEDIAPLVPIANVVMPSQKLDFERRRAFCESLSFNPWHAIKAHKPMGHINRARKFVYASSMVYRSGGGLAHEPTDFEGFDAAPAAH